MKRTITALMAMLVSTSMLMSENGGETKNGSELAKYEKLYVWVTPENPYKKTPVINITDADVLPRLKVEHPRMFVTKDRMTELKNQAVKDTLLQKYINQVLGQADKMVKATSIKNDREILDRIFTLGFAYHWTGDVIYAENAKKLLIDICARPEWDWFHFLGGGEATLVAGVGYDIFYNYLDAITRKALCHGIIKNGLNPGIAAYNGAPFGWFRYVHHNWNLVCNSGMVIGAIAIAGDEYNNYYINNIVPTAVKSMTLALNEYAPDGSFPEGPGYWGFATSYTVLALEAMQRSLGTDYGLSKFEGFDKTYYYNLYVTAPNGKLTSYADCSPDTENRPNGLRMWFSGQFNDPYLANVEHDLLLKSKRNAHVYDLFFYEPRNNSVLTNLPSDRYFRGPVEVATMRTNWTNPNASFVQIKAGYNQANHGHLDLGAFEFFTLGEKWFYDLGSDEYLLPDYFDMNGGRWKYFRMSSLSHNVPVINNQNQNIYANSKFTDVNINRTLSTVTVDLSDAYKESCDKMTRMILLDKTDESLIIQDDYVTKKDCKISWRGVTDASIQLKGKTATLTQKGKKIAVKILSPENAKFTIESALQKAPQKENKGVSILKVEVLGTAGNNQLKIEITK